MRTATEILAETNEVARIIYAGMGYQVPDSFKFYEETVKTHPYERNCWKAACDIQLLMTGTDMYDILEELEE